jgi:hypothetical protein
MEGVEIVHPDVGVESQAAPADNFWRRRRSVISLAEMNFDRVARHNGKHRRIQEMAQNAETEKVS